MSDSVLSAVIGASIAIIGLIVAKEGKTSEFRQQWIDALREDIATLISSALDYPAHPLNAKTANECTARILLRLNPKEKPSILLLENTRTLSKLAQHQSFGLKPEAAHDDPAKKTDVDPVRLAAGEVVSSAQVVLKDEWKRVKRGEWRYLTILCIAVISLAISGSVIIYPWLHHLYKIIWPA